MDGALPYLLPLKLLHDRLRGLVGGLAVVEAFDGLPG
jgi:hypothetical protein